MLSLRSHALITGAIFAALLAIGWGGNLLDALGLVPHDRGIQIAVLALMLTVTGLGFRTAVFALWIYSLLPILQNTLVGLRGVDRATVEAARGMGMGPVGVLLRIELPLAMPVMMAGIRTAAVVNVGTAALGTFIGAGGLGAIIEIGINNQRDHLLYVGAGLTAMLALAADWVVGVVGVLVSPRHTQATG